MCRRTIPFIFAIVIFEISHRISLTSGLIFPGTKWCGSGDISLSPEDLGYFKDTDNCCRQHDQCPDRIDGRQKKYGLFNPTIIPRFHCSCEKQFHKCLWASNSNGASIYVGSIYFNALNTRCFQKYHPIAACKRNTSSTYPFRCLEYIYDYSRPEIYQWFDVPLYEHRISD